MRLLIWDLVQAHGYQVQTFCAHDTHEFESWTARLQYRW